jgi:hypothetical protein
MKVEISTHEAANQLLRDDNASWSRPAAFAIAEYYEELQEDHGYGCDSEIEFCWVAIRCYFTEYRTIFIAAEQYEIENYDNDLSAEDALEYFQDRTTVILTDGDDPYGAPVVIEDF